VTRRKVLIAEQGKPHENKISSCLPMWWKLGEGGSRRGIPPNCRGRRALNTYGGSMTNNNRKTGESQIRETTELLKNAPKKRFISINPCKGK